MAVPASMRASEAEPLTSARPVTSSRGERLAVRRGQRGGGLGAGAEGAEHLGGGQFPGGQRRGLGGDQFA